jgi:fused signal recognition particle receptor
MEKNGNLFAFMQKGLHRSREFLAHRIGGLLAKGTGLDEEFFDELEEVLILADLGVKTTTEIIDELKERADRGLIRGYEEMSSSLKEILLTILQESGGKLSVTASPFVIMVIGVNGAGKTTTIGKMAHLFKKEGKKVLLAAGDTFRAAAIEQLSIWADRTGVECIKHQQGGDASAVIFDAISALQSRGYDILIADTAGRLHTNVNLTEELKKMKRVMDKGLSGAPHETLLVLDATSGQNALMQAKMFDEALGVTGLVLTKLDGTAKGGIAVSISHELKKPIRYVGIGEGLDDLKEFHPEEFVEALIGNDSR